MNDLVEKTDLPLAETVEIPERVKKITESLETISKIAEDDSAFSATYDFDWFHVPSHRDTGFLEGKEKLSDYVNKHGGNNENRVQLLASLLKPEDLDFFNLTRDEIKGRIKGNPQYPDRFYRVVDLMETDSRGLNFGLSLPTRIPNVFYDLTLTQYKANGGPVDHEEVISVHRR